MIVKGWEILYPVSYSRKFIASATAINFFHFGAQENFYIMCLIILKALYLLY